MSLRNLAAALATTLILSACGAAHQIESCEAADGVTPVCGFESPEDLVTLPGAAWLAVSQMRRGDAGGNVIAWRVSDGEKTDLWPGGALAPAAGWGDSYCPGPPDEAGFAPHGIDVFTRKTGGTGLLVINHGREAVEFFELGVAGGRPTLWWRGCVVVPPDTWANDVAALPDGHGFVISNMAPHGFSGGLKPGLTLRILFRRPTGFVYEWTPAGAWREVPGTAGTLPNGVAVSADGERVFVAMSTPRKIVSVNRADGSDPRSVDVPMAPDNFAWADDGRLIIAGGAGNMTSALGCQKITAGACGVAYAVSAIDPEEMTAETLLERDGSSAFGMASVAVPVDNELIIGSFIGDRIARTGFTPRP